MKHPSFTLTELLVVRGILSILLALAFPGIGNAKEKARMSTCIFNLRQVGIGFRMYEDDFEKYPPLFQLQLGRVRKYQGAFGGKTGTVVGAKGYELLPMAEERPTKRLLARSTRGEPESAEGTPSDDRALHSCQNTTRRVASGQDCAAV